MATKYPNQIDGNNELPQAIDLVTPVKAESVNNLRGAIIAIEQELGVDPSREFGTVRARLDAMQAEIDKIKDCGGKIIVSENGVVKVSEATELDFVGNNVTVTDMGNGIAQIEVIGGTGGDGYAEQETIAVTVIGQVDFNLTQTPSDDTTVMMFVNGVKQEYGTDYVSVNGVVNYTGSNPPQLSPSDVVEFWYLVSGGGGGPSSPIEVSKDGTTVVSDLTKLNFEGPGFDVVDEGGGVATVTNTGGSGGDGYITVQDEGVNVNTQVNIINFIGADVLAEDSGTPNKVNVYIPPPSFLSHWNSNDGTNGNQAVSETATRTVARISTPFGGEGSPFKTGGWAATNQDASITSTPTFTTPGDTTGFGGDSTMTINVYDADGIMFSFTTPVLIADGVYSSPVTGPIAAGRASVTLSNFGADTTRFKANADVSVDIDGIFADLGFEGGRYYVEAIHTTDSGTDGTGPYTYIQSDLFYDDNPTTPSISSGVAIAETVGNILTKHLSGIEYYILGSDFTVDVTDIDQHNRDTSRTTASLLLRGPEYGLPNLNESPFGTGAADFIGWTNDNNQDDVDYQKDDWEITAANYRYIGPSGNVTGQVRDTWADGAVVASADDEIMIDTFGITSSNLLENFDDEDRRQDSGYNGGATAGNWDSTLTLLAGEAIVFNSRLMAPNQTTYVRSDGPNDPNTDWTTFKPDLNGANPDYTALAVPVDYYRSFVDFPTADRASFSMGFSGSFAAGTALDDLIAGNLEIYVRRIATGGGGNIGPAAPPLRVHLPFNFGLFDDGATVAGSGIREGSSVGNNINCTFGGLSCRDGIYCQVRILNAATQIDAFALTFF